MQVRATQEQTAPTSAPVRTAVVGVSGYAGGELVRLLLAHPRLSVPPLLFARVSEDNIAGSVPLSRLHPRLAGSHQDLEVHSLENSQQQEREIDFVFLALPHEASREVVPEWLNKGVRVIDLSGAWRLKQESNRAVYGLTDADPDAADLLQREAVFGCPELHREEIASARLVANPGCYSSSIILALAPLLRLEMIDRSHEIICDAKSGVSGAGKALSRNTHFMNVADNFLAYSVFGHRHTGELFEQLGLTSEQIQFTPHLLPIPRGILSTIYARLSHPQTAQEIESALRNFYASSPMIRVRSSPNLPTIQDVANTSYCDIGFNLAPDGRRLVLVSCIDNLLKGASGQAVQNLNVMCGWPEDEGLR